MQQPTAFGIPDPHGPVVRCRQQALPVGPECHGENRALVTLEAVNESTAGSAPYEDILVIRDSEHEAPIGTEIGVCNRCLAMIKDMAEPAIEAIPQTCRAVFRGRDDHRAVGTVADRPDRTGVSLERGRLCSGAGMPDSGSAIDRA